MYTAEDLTVVIPTRDRWEITRRTLDGLARQTETGFATIVVVDGDDQRPPALGRDVEVLVNRRAGPGAARNRGAHRARTALVLFLGDDMVPQPGLVATHVAGHRTDTAPETGVLGHVDWHPDISDSRLLRWMDWSASQFNFAGLAAGDDAHWARFYSCNVSLKRDFFLGAGGFDEDFTYYYEDLDCGWRLGERGLRLRFEPAAQAQHLHRYDWDHMLARFDGIALGEHLMATKHPDFEPFFKRRCENALATGRVSPLWPIVFDRLPSRPGRLRQVAQRRANAWWYQRLAPRYLNGYRGADDLDELREYLGDRFDDQKLWHHRHEVESEEQSAPDERTFYRTSEAYLYDLTAFGMWPTKIPYRADLQRVVPPPARLLDYGCGIGTDGLRLLERGYDVAFADFDNPSTRYLRWRLARRDLHPPVYDIEGEVPSDFDAVYAFDVLEHVDDPRGFLDRLERLAPLVVVNLVGPDPGDTHLHKPLDIGELLAYMERRGLVHYRRYHGRVHLVAYRSDGGGGSRARRWVERRRGAAVSRVKDRLERLPQLLA
ncbi:MAG: glycosyltransferase [Acidimicrobiales bacterium]